MNLQQFLNFYRIKPESLEAIKKRVFVVGKFNTSESDVSAYLFSRPARQDDRYKASCGLSYTSFIDVIRPTLTESYEIGEEIAPGQYLPYFVLSPQTTDRAKGDASYVIDPYNYFFQRAISTSKHQHYLQNKDANSNGRLPENTAGETIYKEIRLNLKKFCSFQSKNYDLIRAFSQLLHANRGKGGIPGAFADGQVLPVKFLPLFIDFLYQEGPFPFRATEVDFESQKVWRNAVSGPGKEKFLINFSKIVSAFKNYMIDPKGLSKEKIDNVDLKMLPDFVDEHLQKSFVASRDAYNMLRQIIRSKVLLSMVLQWAIRSFHDLESVKKEISDQRKNIAIEKAIKSGTDGLAVPAKKAEGKSVSDMIADFKENFPKIIEFVNQPEEPNAKKAFSELSDFLQDIGYKILDDEIKANNIRLVLQMHPDQKRATLQALENYFVDVLIPRIFKEPGLTLEELKRKFNHYETTLLQQISLMEVAKTNNLQDLEQMESYADKLAFAIGRMVEILADTEVVTSILRVAQMSENQVFQRALMPDSMSIGKSVPLLAPIENATTDAFEDSIKVPVSDEIIVNIELERPGTLEKIRKMLPSAGMAGNGVSKHVVGAGTEVKQLAASEKPDGSAIDESQEIDAGALPVAQEREIEQQQYLALKKQALERLGINGSNDLKLALQNYVNADESERGMILAEVKHIIQEDVKYYHYNLSKIYSKYAEPTVLTNFKNMVEAMTLSQLLLVHQNELHLDKAGTNLFDLLLDLVEFIDNPEKPDLKKFFSKNSLTKYISEQYFNHNGSGFSALEAGLKNQAEKSLNNVKQYVSELQGVKYLLDVLEESSNDCEVIVVNARWNEFLDWVVNNINDSKGNLLNPAGLAENNKTNPQFPVIAYMTELSFNNGEDENTHSQKISFLEQLSDIFSKIGAANGNKNVAVLPPICISTSEEHKDSDDSKNKSKSKEEEWVSQGIELNERCRKAYSPVLILGPSVPLNSKEDSGFNTTLAAGYLFCTHLLNGGNLQKIDLTHVNALSQGRFRVIGSGVFGITNTFKNLIEAPDTTYDYSLAADFYLYVIALLAAAQKYNDKAADSNILEISERDMDFWRAFYNCFYSNANFKSTHSESGVLNRVSLFKDMTDWSLKNDIAAIGEQLEGVQMFTDNRKDNFRLFSNIHWFNNLRESLRISKLNTTNNNNPLSN